MQEFHRNLIRGAPLREASHFNGPLSWWTNGLPCGGLERQIISEAQYFQDKGRPITLLCLNLEARYGNAFFLKEAQRYCLDVLQFSTTEIDMSALDHVRTIVSSFLEGCSLTTRDTIACLALWLVHVRPRLLQVWNADNLNPLLAAVIAGVPLIVVMGSSLPPIRRSPYGFEGVDEKLGFTILANIMRQPGVYMTNNSRAGCRDYEDWLGLRRGSVTYTPNVFDLSLWPRPDEKRITALRHHLRLPEGARVLGGLFRFVSIKDPELWVCTALRVCAEHPDLYAVIGGNGPDMSALKARIAISPFAERILFPGALKDVPAFLSLCDVFLHTAYVEGLPNAVIEAQAYKVPVVTTRCGGVADIVAHGKSGFIVDERDETVLAHHVSFILRHADFAAQAGLSGRERVSQSFSPDVAMAQLQHLYDAIFYESERAESENDIPACSVEGSTSAPLVSIVLPVCRQAPFLQETVNSVLQQTYPNFELIIVVDSTRVDTALCSNEYASPRVRVLDGTGLNLPSLLNKAISSAEGTYITSIEADNLCLPHFCEAFVQALEATPQAVIATAPIAHINVYNFVSEYESGEAIFDHMLCTDEGVKAFMCRLDAVRQVGVISADLEGAESLYMSLCILDRGRSVYVTRLPYYIRDRKSSVNDPQLARNQRAIAYVVNQALQRVEKRGGIEALYPQIADCSNKELALFHANLLFGSRMLNAKSQLKAKAAEYLGRAYAMRPNDVTALGNYAVALAFQGRSAEAQELFLKGESVDHDVFSFLRERCMQQSHNANTPDFDCPTLECFDAKESELVRRVERTRLVFRDYQE